MPETGTSGSMSGDGKRGVGHRPQVTAPILDSTETEVPRCPRFGRDRVESRHEVDIARSPSLTDVVEKGLDLIVVPLDASSVGLSFGL